MRDPERIEEILELVKTIWVKDQDLRFQQLLYILQSDYSQKNNDAGKVETVEKDGFIKTGYDLFNIEDDSFTEFLKKVVKNGL